MARIILETERLRLREFAPSDIDDVREMLTDAYAERFFQRITADPHFAERWVERNQGRYRDDGFGLWAVVIKESGEFAGDCGLTLQELGDSRLLEVGYHMKASVRGRGYATEAARGCLHHAFDTLDVDRVYSMVDCENDASRTVAERIHHQREDGHIKYGRPIYLFSTDRESLVVDPDR